MEFFIRESVDKYYLTWENPLTMIDESENSHLEKPGKLVKVKIDKLRSGISSSITKDLIDKSIRFTLEEIFNLPEELVEKFYNMTNSTHYHSLNLEMKASICIALLFRIVDEEQKYVTRHTFFTNMTLISDFNKAIEVFYFGESMFDERFLNLSRSTGSFLLPSPSVNNRIDFDKRYEDIYLYFLNLIRSIVMDKVSKNIRIDSKFNTCIFKTFTVMDPKNFYDKMSNFIDFIIETDFIESFCISNSGMKEFIGLSNKMKEFNITSFINAMRPDINIVKQILDKLQPINYITAFNKLRILADISSTGQNCDFLTEFYLSVINDDNNIFEHIFVYYFSHYSIGDDIRDSFKIVYEFCKNVRNILDINEETILWIMSIPINKLDEYILKLRLIKFLRNSGRMTKTVFGEFIQCFKCIEEKEGTYYMYHTDQGRGQFTNDTADNYLYTRLARTFLMRKFLSTNIHYMNSLGVGRTTLNANSRRELILQEIQIYNNLTIDVHDEGRDKKTREAIRILLDLNEYGEFKTIDPFENMDHEINETQAGRLSKTTIDQLVNDFFEYARVNLSYEESLIFFRVMGYNYDGEEIILEEGDFNGFLCETHNLDKNYMDGKIILAYLWEYSNQYSSEGLKDVMLNTVKKCIQDDEYMFKGKLVKKKYAVCNPGKLQRFVVALLQGHFKLPSGDYVMIDNIDLMKRKVDRDIPLRRNHVIETINPSQAYELIRPYIDFTNNVNRPGNANEFFKGLFEHIFMNGHENHMFEIIETLCVYSEDKNGLTIKPDFAIANQYEGMFKTDDYIIVTEQIKNIEAGQVLNYDVFDDEYDDVFDGDEYHHQLEIE